MKKLNSLLSLVLCIAMLLAVAGCNSKKPQEAISSDDEDDDWEVIVNEYDTTGENGNDASGGQSGNKTTTPSNGGSAAATANAKNKDFLASLKGLEINIYTQMSEKPTRGTTSGDKYFAVLNKVSKQYGVKINYLSETPGGLQQSILSGKPLANVIGIQDYNFASWLNVGTAADLTKAMKETGITFTEKWYNQDTRKISNLNNKQYAFTSDIYAPSMIVYNKRMIQEAGLTDPIKLYNEGKWNFDEFTRYLKKLNKESSDGTTLIYGLNASTVNSLAAYVMGMNGVDSVIVKDGKMVNNVTNQKAKNALSYIGKWRTVDKVINYYANWKDAFTTFSQGKAAMVFGTKYAFDNIAEYGMKDAVGVVPFPYGPNASAKTEYIYEQLFLNIIPKSEEKNATKILFVMNEIYKELYSLREDNFKSDYRALIRDNTSYELFKNYSLGNKKLKFSNYLISGIIWGDYQAMTNLMNSVSTGNAVETAVGTYSSAITTALNEVWGKWEITGK